MNHKILSFPVRNPIRVSYRGYPTKKSNTIKSNDPQCQPPFSDPFLLLVKTMIQDQVRQLVVPPSQVQYSPLTPQMEYPPLMSQIQYPNWPVHQPQGIPTM